MRVVVKAEFRAYLNMQPETFTKGQELKGSTAVYLLEAGAPVEPMDDEAREHLEAIGAPDGGDSGPSGPPTELDIEGTAAGVLAWVGEDPERAKVALAAEEAKDKPRSTLVKALEKLAEQD